MSSKRLVSRIRFLLKFAKPQRECVMDNRKDNHNDNRKGLRKRYVLLASVLVLIAAYFLFANTIIKSILEKQLSQSNGAEVNIGSVSHGLMPVRITLNDIQMTDAAKPEFNKVFVHKASADIDITALMSNQVIVDELALVDMTFGTQRLSPGYVLAVPESTFNFDQWLAQKAEEAPSVDDVLASSPLKTTAAIADAKDTYETYGPGLKEDYKALPNKDKFEYYKKEIEAIKNTNYKDPQALLEAKEKLETLKQEMLEDKEKVSAFTEKAKLAQSALSESVEALKTAPAEDYDLLKGLVAGDAQAIEQVTLAVFGEEAAQYTQYVTAAVQMLAPMLSGDSSTASEETAPSDPMQILIRKANVSVNWEGERISSVWENITNMHTVFGSPTTFTFSGAGEKLANFASNGQFWIDEEGIDASQQWQLDNAAINDVAVADDERFSATISKALLSSVGSLNIENNALKGSSDVNLSSLAMLAKGDDDITRTIASTLEGLNDLSMKIDLDGSVTAPGFGLSSDLDQQMMQAAMSQLSAGQQDKLDELNNKLNAMASEQLGANDAQLVDITSLLSAAQGDSATLDELLASQLDNLVEKEKDKLLNKLFNKLKN